MALRVFQSVDNNLVTVRILHDGHPAHRTFNCFGGKTSLRLFQALDGGVKVFDFNSNAGAVFGWLPLIAHAADGQRVGTNLIFDPNTFAKFARDFESEHSFVKPSSTFYVRYRDSSKCNLLRFHFFPAAAFMAFCAASAKSSAAITARPESAINFFPASTFVPSSRTTSGTDSFNVFAALMIPSAMMSYFMIPPKMLTKIAFTFLSAIRILKASVPCSSVAPPPTSRKLAGSPPYNLMMSIVAIARPAPFTRQAMFPSRPMELRPCFEASTSRGSSSAISRMAAISG